MAPAMAPRPSGMSIVFKSGPVVHVTRGKDTETVTVGGN